MQFSQPLLRGTLVTRYKRFFADVALADGSLVTAHCPNPGSMLSVSAPGSIVWLSETSNPARALKYTWELVEVGYTLVGINTGLPNRLAAEAVQDGAIPALAGYARLRREVRYGKGSRIDLLLEDGQRPTCFLEIKNVTLRRGGGVLQPVEFPDSVTERGLKHLYELIAVVQAGQRAVMLFVAQRSDAPSFRVAADIDPRYAQALQQAVVAGVEVLCYSCDVSLAGVRVAAPVAVELPA
ncbi:MAG: DNA/RNA nuclease SfsA [Defluviicoccus sp.]